MAKQVVPLKAIIVLVTCPGVSQANRLAKSLVSRRLAACVNVLRGIKSHFIWQGKVQSCTEVLLVIKTQKRLFRRLKDAIRKLHAYETPEIIALPISDGDGDYLAWICASVSSSA